MQVATEMTTTINALCLIAFPLVIAFVLFNICRVLLGAAIYNHSISRRTYAICGLIGTPIHELSHLIAALLFGHRIVGIKLFSWNSGAYVSHSYNKHSAFQVAGNFFIAIAPFVTSIALIHTLSFNQFNISISLEANPLTTMLQAIKVAPDLLKTFLMVSEWWEIVLIAMLTFYCIPSNTDFSNAIRSSVLSLPILIALLFVLTTLIETTMNNIVGTVMLIGIVSSMISVAWWVGLYILTFIPCSNYGVGENI